MGAATQDVHPGLAWLRRWQSPDETSVISSASAFVAGAFGWCRNAFSCPGARVSSEQGRCLSGLREALFSPHQVFKANQCFLMMRDICSSEDSGVAGGRAHPAA